MHGKPITKQEIKKIIELRRTGHSLPEIMRTTKRCSSTVFKYIKNVQVFPKYLSILKIKQGGSRRRADNAWQEASIRAHKMMAGSISKIQRIGILVGIYWGEGNKNELNLINSDPSLIKTFISCLHDIGINNNQIKIGLRLHEEINKDTAVRFWSDYLSMESNKISGIETIKRGNKKGKLKYGMCRVRVAKSAPYFKLIISLINEIRLHFNAAVVQRIEQGTPKP